MPRIKVQVKRHEGKISVAGLRSFLAVLGEHEVGLFVCTGGFTGDAEEEARTQETRKVMLLGLEQLFDIWVQYYGKSADEDKKLLPAPTCLLPCTCGVTSSHSMGTGFRSASSGRR